jgi:hypothetical protein
MNTVLMGCKPWTMFESNCRRLVTFQYKGSRWILNINMHQVHVTEWRTQMSAKFLQHPPHTWPHHT